MQIHKTISILIAVVYLTTCFPSSAWSAPNVVGQSAVLIDSNSGKILYAKNANEPKAPASTTKILTAVLALQKSKLTDTVTAGKNATLVEPSAIGLKEGEKITVENLLYSLMLKSANDAAVALAEHISGSTGNFAELMNNSAKAWGATNSHFANPNGLPDPNHYSTAHDLAVITKHAMENPVFRKIVATKVKVIPRTDDTAIKWLQNHNKLLWRYDGAVGVKTGYTKEAKQCLVASAEKNGQEFIAVILGSEGSNIWSDAQTLLDYGFNNFVTYKQKNANVVVKAVEVGQGSGKVDLVTQEAFFYTIPRGERETVTEKAEVKANITAPVKKGQALGKLRFFSGGKEIGSVNMIAGNDVSARGFGISGSTQPLDPLFIVGLLLGMFIVWNIRKRKRKRRKKRLWINRAIR